MNKMLKAMLSLGLAGTLFTVGCSSKESGTRQKQNEETSSDAEQSGSTEKE